jgi:hypothetical protein
MRRAFAVVLALVGSLTLAGAASATQSGTTTINLRAWEGTSRVDGVLVCLARGAEEIVCGETEDGELWVDSLPHGPYQAWVEPTEHALLGITCTTFPDVAYRPCRARGSEVRFVVGKDVVAVNINFSLATLD